MNCPNCGKTNAESASFCIFCGAPIVTTKVKEENAPRFKGSLSSRITAEDTKSDLRGKEAAPQEKNDSYNNSPTSAPYDSGLAREEPSRVGGDFYSCDIGSRGWTYFSDIQKTS